LAARCATASNLCEKSADPRASAVAGAVSAKDDIITTLLAAHKMAQSRRECGDDDATVENLHRFCAADMSVRGRRPAPKARAAAGQETCLLEK
jgi:hypothetical protein